MFFYGGLIKKSTGNIKKEVGSVIDISFSHFQKMSSPSLLLKTYYVQSGKRRGIASDSENEGDENVGDETESDEESLANSDEMYFLSDSEVYIVICI